MTVETTPLDGPNARECARPRAHARDITHVELSAARRAEHHQARVEAAADGKEALQHAISAVLAALKQVERRRPQDVDGLRADLASQLVNIAAQLATRSIRKERRRG
jgi:flagellar biosynthesis/type III secretory pathway protein FliH